MIEVATRNGDISRTRQLVWPREHGAWGILIVPMVTGAAVGLMHSVRLLPALLFAVAAVALFCLRTPVESLLGSTPLRARTAAERRLSSRFIAIFGALAGLSLTLLLWGGQNLVLLAVGAVAVLLFVLQAVMRSYGLRMAAQFTGALGLTSTAAGAYYVTTGHMDAVALALWGVNWMFAANQVHFVQLRIHGARQILVVERLASGWPFLAGQLLMILFLLAAWRLAVLPGMAVLAFAPVSVRGVAWFFARPKPLQVRRLGFTELAHAVLFGVLLIVGFAV